MSPTTAGSAKKGRRASAPAPALASRKPGEFPAPGRETSGTQTNPPSPREPGPRLPRCPRSSLSRARGLGAPDSHPPAGPSIDMYAEGGADYRRSRPVRVEWVNRARNQQVETRDNCGDCNRPNPWSCSYGSCRNHEVKRTAPHRSQKNDSIPKTVDSLSYSGWVRTARQIPAY